MTNPDETSTSLRRAWLEVIGFEQDCQNEMVAPNSPTWKLGAKAQRVADRIKKLAVEYDADWHQHSPNQWNRALAKSATDWATGPSIDEEPVI